MLQLHLGMRTCFHPLALKTSVSFLPNDESTTGAEEPSGLVRTATEIVPSNASPSMAELEVKTATRR